MPLVPVFPVAETAAFPDHPRRRRRESVRGASVREGTARDHWTAAHGELAVVQVLARRRLLDDGPSGIEIMPTRARALLSEPHAGLLGQIAAGWPDSPVALSHAGPAIDASRLTGQVAGFLEVAHMPAFRLELVLPETALITLDTDGLLALSALRDLGIGLCLDAFGAGVTSLTVLRRLPLTSLKLARPLVRAVPAGREDATFLRAIVATAHAVGLTVIGDGIETEHQRAFLAHSGCDEGQGPLFGPPIQITALPRHGILA